MDDPSTEPEDQLIMFITESGFKLISMQTIIDALAAMEEYIMDEAGVEHEELEQYLDRIENLVGREEAMTMDVDDVVSWIKAVRGH